MAGDGADVRSVQALRELTGGLQRFSGRAREILEAAVRLAQREQRRATKRHEAAQRSLASAESAYHSAGEDEYAAASARLEEAETALSEAAARHGAVEDRAGAFLRHASRLQRVVVEEIPQARAQLGRKLEILDEYAATQLEGDASPALVTTASAAPAAPAHSHAGGTIDPVPRRFDHHDITQLPLPPSFVWVPLRDIDLENELRGVEGEADFEKVSYAEMRAGCVKLREQVLPLMAQDMSRATPDYFAKRDQQAGIDYEHGLQRVYEAFLSPANSIYLGRGREEQQFRIINGRHRIKIARELGWSAVPARAKDLRSS